MNNISYVQQDIYLPNKTISRTITGKEILDFANEIKETINNYFNIQLKEEVLVI